MLQGKFLSNSKVDVMLSPRPSSNLGLKSGYVLENLGAQPTKAKEITNQKVVQDRPHAANETRPNPNASANNNSGAPATKCVRVFVINLGLTMRRSSDPLPFAGHRL